MAGLFFNDGKWWLSYGVQCGAIDRNPLSTARPLKVVKTFRFFSKKEINELIDEAKEPLRTGIIILVNTGMRRAELFNL